MSVSQFKVYRSSDVSAPSLTGSSGALIGVLDGCLVTGYGTKVAAGWTHPVATASNIASYQQPAGAGLCLLVNDASPNVTSLGKEAWATGWETVAGVGSPVGTGTGQFPTPGQLLTTGHTVIRKSVTNDNTNIRQWLLFADASTFYLFVATADTAGQYFSFGFGDVYTLSLTDTSRVIIMGRNTENSTLAAAEGFELFSVLNTAVVGNFMPRSYTNLGTSITVGKHGDATKGSAVSYVGTLQYPNAEDAELYLSPVWVVENATPNIRGLLRGLYQPLHAIANFTDGQTFSGTGAYAGKTFIVIKQTPSGGAVFVETSNTVLTN